MNLNQKFEIIDRKLDYLKLIIYRDKKTFLTWKEDQPKPTVCSITDKIKSDLGLKTEFKGIINEKGIGINSSFNTKLYLDFRGEFLLLICSCHCSICSTINPYPRIKFRQTHIYLVCLSIQASYAVQN